MTGLEMLQHTEFTVMRDYINNAPIVNYGIVLEVYSQKSVKVAVMSSIEETTLKLDCSVLFTSSSHLEVSHKLEVGDKGLILSLQHSAKDIFSAEEPLTKEGRKGYSVFSCVFIPYNTLKEADETTTKLTLDDEKILLKTKVPVTIESEKELIADVKEVQLCGDADTLVMFNALKTDLGNWKTSIENAVKAHTHPISIAVTGTCSTGPIGGTAAGTSSAPVSFSTSLDISSSEAKKVKTS
jgi:hypothetical protein